jgi:hypothetical protein|tara:strand:- start:590 stop:772 length:183 start_codon:yes stop_codon:yes gene_type:complete
MRDFIKNEIIWNTIGNILQNENYKDEFAQQLILGGSMFKTSGNDSLKEAISKEFVNDYQP